MSSTEPQALPLTAKVAVVTGAAKGIGEATARALHRDGAAVVLLDVDEAGAAVAASLGGRAWFIRCDVADGVHVSNAFVTIAAQFPRVDVLVNNAGIQHYGSVTTTPEAEWDRVMAVNLKSAFLCARHAIPLMLRERGGGVVINVSSVQAFVSQASGAAYVTSKTALLGLTRSIAIDYAPHVRCVAVCPGVVDTPMLRAATAHKPPSEPPPPGSPRMAKPEEIAELIAYLASDRASFINGEAIRIDGGLGISLPGTKPR
jgi:NAD(P)-dependent dehydrogenase (short-subunit alcohol dehydrogenase family)